MEALRKLFTILEKPFRKRLYVLSFYLIIGVFLESIGIGLVIPLVGVITDIKLPGNDLVGHWLGAIFSNNARDGRMVVVLVTFLLFYLIKALFFSFLAGKQSAFGQDLSQHLSNRLFSGYISQPYAFFLNNNSSVLMKNIVSEVGTFTLFVQALLSFQIELSILLGVGIMLVILQPWNALIVLVFVASLAFVMIRFTRNRVVSWGKARQDYDAARSKSLLQGFLGIAELKLFKRKDFFLGLYKKYNDFFYDSQRKINFVVQAQRYYLEFFIVFSFVLLCFFVEFGIRTAGVIFPSISLFLFASLRLFPSVNRLIVFMQSMSFAGPAVDLVYRELSKFDPEKETTVSPGSVVKVLEKEIRLEKISFTYPGADRAVLEDVSLNIMKGSVVGIMGPSGAAKTTLMQILTGLLVPSAGKIWIDNTEVTNRVEELQDFIGYVPQNIFLLDDTIMRNIAFGVPDEFVDMAKLQEVIHIAELQEFVSSVNQGIHTVIGERGMKISGGQRQRVGIARALYIQPQILILDEGTSALDSLTELCIMTSLMRLKGKLIIVLVAHRHTTLSFCDFVVKMQNGKIIARGKFEEVI